MINRQVQIGTAILTTMTISLKNSVSGRFRLYQTTIRKSNVPKKPNNSFGNGVCSSFYDQFNGLFPGANFNGIVIKVEL